MVVTELGIITDVKPLHAPNAELPILVTVYVLPIDTVSGITTEPE